MERRLLMAYYGDDFTGSTDSLEALTMNGVNSVLFITPPTHGDLSEKYPNVQCIGLAGTSRSMQERQLATEMRKTFQWMKQLNASVVHYKICSTGDSSPQYGSVGRAIEVANEFFTDYEAVPLLVAVPRLGRYTVFSNHFADIDGITYRLDRHPVMSKHPVTPMKESNLRKHFSQQTALPIRTMTIKDLMLSNSDLENLYEQKMSTPGVLLFDTLYESHLQKVGRLWWDSSITSNTLFVAGSSGVQYALIEKWRSANLVPSTNPTFTSPGSVSKTLILSGSCSSVTHKQIQWALESGFEGVSLSITDIMDEGKRQAEFSSVLSKAKKSLDNERSLIIYSSLTSSDTEENRLQIKGIDTGRQLGSFLGELAKSLVKECGVSRLVIAGGDTSGYATQELGITALRMIYPTAKGAPLCRCHADEEYLDGVELALKGGQLGQVDYFGRILNGT